MNDFKSIGDILRGNGSNQGFQHTTSWGARYTVGPTEDPRYPGGTYVSVNDVFGDKRTVVLDNHGQIVRK
ncbi:MAG: hypothetical protein HY259_11630 [Chloroflexi bacterium]|nr:hypothetical protein [Chloroflexota bacterium]MBI3734088.1 hypothetical protein [Chloroflexota bacterium]